MTGNNLSSNAGKKRRGKGNCLKDTPRTSQMGGGKRAGVDERRT